MPTFGRSCDDSAHGEPKLPRSQDSSMIVFLYIALQRGFKEVGALVLNDVWGERVLSQWPVE